MATSHVEPVIPGPTSSITTVEMQTSTTAKTNGISNGINYVKPLSSSLYPVKPGSTSITTVEMHTAGEPVRIIGLNSGMPNVEGKTLADKLKFARSHLNHYRNFLMLEPRGHRDMYGQMIVKADHPDADIAVIFMHTTDFAEMCGHCVIALGRYAVDNGMVKALTHPETRVNIQCPCGLVETYVQTDGRGSPRTRFRSVPAFVFAIDVALDVPNYGKLSVDISFGGNFYAILPASSVGLDLAKSSVGELAEAAHVISTVTRAQVKLDHPGGADMAYLYGTILTDGQDTEEEPSHQMCVFADHAVDRSPCGSGTTARLAVQYHRKYIGVDKKRAYVSPTGSTFYGTVVRTLPYHQYTAIVAEISGNACYTGSCTFTLEDSDVAGLGFLLD